MKTKTIPKVRLKKKETFKPEVIVIQWEVSNDMWPAPRTPAGSKVRNCPNKFMKAVLTVDVAECLRQFGFAHITNTQLLRDADRDSASTCINELLRKLREFNKAFDQPAVLFVTSDVLNILRPTIVEVAYPKRETANFYFLCERKSVSILTCTKAAELN